MRARSTAASVCPARTSTPPSRARRGNTCPGLARSTAAQQEYLLDPALTKGIEGVFGNVRPRQLVDRASQDSGHVHGNIAVADHHHLLGSKVEALVAVVGMAVVPPDKCGCRMAPWQIFAPNAQTSVTLGAGGKQDLVVMSQDLCQGEIRAEPYVPEETKAGSRGGFLELLDDAFRLFVVRGDATANEAVRSRQAVEQVHGDAATGSLQQLLGREKSGRSGAEDSNPQRVCCASNLAVAGETLNRGLLTTAAGGALVRPNVVPGLLILAWAPVTGIREPSQFGGLLSRVTHGWNRK